MHAWLIICSVPLLFSSFFVSLFAQQWPEAIAVLIVILVNSFIGFFTEWKALQSMEALRLSTEAECLVLREGKEQRVQVSDIVPGDLLSLKVGEVVAARERPGHRGSLAFAGREL